MVTLEDISLEVGCSVNTVSRALNNKPDVSKETKKRVLEAAKRLGYVPNTLAKSLVTKVSGSIGVLLPTLDNPLYAKALEIIESRVFQYNYSVILAQTNTAAGVDPVEVLYQKRIDGLLVIPSSQDCQGLDVIKRYNIPAVCVLHEPPGWDQSFVGIDEQDAACSATQHLIQLGRRKIRFAKAATYGENGVQGYLKALSDYGISDKHVLTVEPKPASGYSLCKELIRSGDEFDGLILPHDVMFPGVYTALAEYGLDCPRDVSIIGFGNADLCPYFQVPLSSMEIPLQFLCSEALRLLIDGIRLERTEESEPVTRQRIIKDVKLIIRKSCGARLS